MKTKERSNADTGFKKNFISSSPKFVALPHSSEKLPFGSEPRVQDLFADQHLNCQTWSSTANRWQTGTPRRSFFAAEGFAGTVLVEATPLEFSGYGTSCDMGHLRPMLFCHRIDNLGA